MLFLHSFRMEKKACTPHALVRQSVTLNTPCDVDQRIYFIPWRDTGFVCVCVHCRTPSILWFLIVLTEFSRRLYNTYYTPTVSALGFETQPVKLATLHHRHLRRTGSDGKFPNNYNSCIVGYITRNLCIL